MYEFLRYSPSSTNTSILEIGKRINRVKSDRFQMPGKDRKSQFPDSLTVHNKSTILVALSRLCFCFLSLFSPQPICFFSPIKEWNPLGESSNPFSFHPRINLHVKKGNRRKREESKKKREGFESSMAHSTCIYIALTQRCSPINGSSVK